MGRFINTKRTDTINNLVDGYKNRMKNPYYMLNNQSPTVVDFYLINETMSSLDEGLQDVQDHIGPNSPLRYNKIQGFYLYGIDSISVDLDQTEFGTEGSEISGSATVLPNTIKPVPGSLFSIPYLNKNYIFKVTDVNVDTLENEVNFYEIRYVYYREYDEQLEFNVVETFNYLPDNVGSQFKSVIKNVEYNYIELVESITNRLKEYYIEIFFNKRVSTFTYDFENIKVYDEYLLEFLIRNKILEGDLVNHVHVSKQMTPSRHFNIQYDKTFFRALELRETTKLTTLDSINLIYVDDALSTLSMRPEDYYYAEHISRDTNIGFNKRIPLFDKEFYDRIKNNEQYPLYELLLNLSPSGAEVLLKDGFGKSIEEAGYFLDVKTPGDVKLFDEDGNEVKEYEELTPEQKSQREILNIIIKFMNKETIYGYDVKIIEDIEYEHRKYLYYYIPILIFCLEKTIESKIVYNGNTTVEY